MPLLMIGAGAFLVRTLVTYQVRQMPTGQAPSYDALDYLTWGRRIASFDFTWPVPPAHAPLYPFLLGGMLLVTSGSLFGVQILQSILGAGTVVVSAMTAKRWFGERAGYTTGILLAIYAPLAWVDVLLLAEGLLIFLLALLLWCLASEQHPALTGAVLGLAAITRPTALAYLPLIMIAGARNWKARLTMGAATILMIIPVTFANWSSSHAFIPIQAFGGMNFYLGNSPLRDGTASARRGGDWDRIEPEAARHGFAQPAAEDRYFFQKTRNEILHQPSAAARLLVRKLFWTFQNEEIRDTESFYFYRQFATLLHWLPTFTLLLALAVTGAVLADWQSRAVRIVAAYIALSAAVCVFLVVGTRYRMPIVIGLAIFSGVAIRELTARRLDIRAIAAVCAGLALGACTRIWEHPASHNFAEDHALFADALRRQGETAGAEREARRAIAIDSANALAWDELALTLAAAGRLPESIDAFQRATSLNSQFSAAHMHAGDVAKQLGNLDLAATEYAAAAQSDPRNLHALKLIGDLDLDRGEVTKAEAAYQQFLALQPNNADVLFAYARVEGALGRPDHGLGLFAKGASLRDPTGEEWLLQATLAMDARQFNITSAAIARARGQMGEDPRVRFVEALFLLRQQRYLEAQSEIDAVIKQQPDFPQAAALRREILARRARTASP